MIKLVKWYHKSLKNRFMLMLFIGTLFPILIISIITYLVTVNTIYNNSYNSIKKNLSSLAAGVDTVRFRIVSFSEGISNNYSLQEILKNENPGDDIITRYKREKLIESGILAPITLSLNYENRIIINSKNDTVYTNFKTEVTRSTNYEEFLQNLNSKYSNKLSDEYAIQWMETEKDIFEMNMLSHTRVIRDSFGNDFGRMFIFVDSDIINDLFSQQGYSIKDEVMLVNDEGTILCHSVNSFIGQSIQEVLERAMPGEGEYFVGNVNGEKKLISSLKIPNSTWTLVNAVPSNYLLQSMNIIRNSIIFSILLVGLGTLFAERLILNKITASLRFLQKKALEISSGNLDVTISIAGEDEVSELAVCMDRMVKKIRDLITDTILQQQLNARLEIKAYQAQLNPHFLHNTLNNIKWIAISKQEQQIADMITALGTILERAMRNRSGMNKVQNELELLENYISIQQFRYNGKFEVLFNIDEEIFQLYIPILILQPILENSMFHGIGRKKFITICLNGFLRKDQVILQILDDGCGISNERLEHLWEDNIDEDNHIGLLNVKRRVQLKYGNGYDLKIKSKEGEGTEVEINLPVIKELSNV